MSKIRQWFGKLLVGLALLGLGAAGAWIWIERTGRADAARDVSRTEATVFDFSEAVMPDLVGLHVFQAQVALEALGVESITVVEQSIASSTDQVVVRQSPTEGSAVSEIVTLTVSRSEFLVPDVLGLDSATALEILVSQGFSEEDLEIVPQVQAGTPGLVLDQSPGPGSLDPSTVTLTVTASTQTPNLVGLSEVEAAEILESIGSSAAISYVYDQDTELGEVLDQVPAPGVGALLITELVVAGEGSEMNLTALSSVDYSGCSRREVTVNGVAYPDSLGCAGRANSTSESFLEYDLSRSWNQLALTVGIEDSEPVTSSAEFRVFGDGVLLGTVQVKFGESFDFDLDVRGVLRLRLEADALTPESEAIRMAWGSPTLVGQPEVVQP